jgi:hypothetical protein
MCRQRHRHAPWNRISLFRQEAMIEEDGTTGPLSRSRESNCVSSQAFF